MYAYKNLNYQDKSEIVQNWIHMKCFARYLDGMVLDLTHFS